mgnify:CR=1 FL=1
MKTFKLAAKPRTELGKKATKALRAQNLIPVVLNGGEIFDLPYAGTLKPGEKIVEIGNGKGLLTTDLTVSNDAVRKLVYTPDIFAIELDINGETRMAVLKDIQFQPVKDNILHIDRFVAVHVPGSDSRINGKSGSRQARRKHKHTNEHRNYLLQENHILSYFPFTLYSPFRKKSRKASFFARRRITEERSAFAVSAGRGTPVPRRGAQKKTPKAARLRGFDFFAISVR